MKVDKNSYDQRMLAFHRVCAEKAFRVTPQRLEIYRELARAGDHPSAEALHKRVVRRLPTVTLDTVYRTLAKLEEIGLVDRVSVVGSFMRFEANDAHHHHFVCRRCGVIHDVFLKKMDHAKFENDLPAGCVADWVQVELRGTCPKCVPGGK
jgi:Fur family peroxide stress response transcriptional regulator